MTTLQIGQYVSDNSNSIPVGTIVMYISTTPPKGWLLCDGTLYLTTNYPALFSVLQRQYGGTSGAGTFAVPSLSSNVPVGQGGSIAGSLGATGGVSSVTLTAAESGYPSHTHATIDTYATTSSAVDTGGTYSDWDPQDAAKSTGNNASTNVSATSSHENRMPYLALSYIIKAF